MTEAKLMEYTSKDGPAESFGLGDRWLLEPFDHTQHCPDKRLKLEPIGDVMLDYAAAAKNDDIASILHLALSDGRIVASGRFGAKPLFEGGMATELPFRAIIPASEFRSNIAFSGNNDVDFVYYDDPDASSQSWISYHWSKSHIEYIAEGCTVDTEGEEWFSFNRWVCTWSAMLVCRNQVGTVLGREIPQIRPFARPKSRPVKKDEEIIAKIEQMRLHGKHLTDICRDIRQEPGFENVGNRFAASLVKGRWKSGPNQKNSI